MQRYLICLAILIATLLPTPVWAQFTEEMCYFNDPPPPFFAQQVKQVVEAIPERPSREPGVFYRNWVEINYSEGQAVILTGSRDLHPYKTDDRMRLTASPSGKVWEHDFRSADRMAIVPMETYQDITDLLVPGVNTLEIVLEDIMGPVYSSSSYWIMVLERCPAPEAAADEIDTEPTREATPTPAPTEIVPTATPTEAVEIAAAQAEPPAPAPPQNRNAIRVQPTAAATAAVAKPIIVMPTAESTAQVVQTAASDAPAPIPVWRWVMLSLAILGGSLAWVWQRYRPDWRMHITALAAPLYQEIGVVWKQIKAEILQPKR